MRFFSPLRPLLKGWLLSFIGWSLVGFVMAAHGVTTRGDSWWVHVEPSIRTWLPWAVFTPLIFRLVARLPLDRMHWRLAVPVHLVCCAGVVFVSHWWKESFGRGANPSARPGQMSFGPGPARESDPPRGPRPSNGFRGPGGPPPGSFDSDRPPRPPDDQFGRLPPGRGSQRGRNGPPGPPPGRGTFDMLQFLSFEIPIYVMLLTGAHAALFGRRDQERAASLARARLDALRMRLQPHFLFNTLNTIAGLVHENPDKADAILTSLSELLRMSLDTSDVHEFPLQRELDFIERYLELMHARFEDRLLYTLDITPETRGALVPPMLLQPLVENAVEHGLMPRQSGGLVTVCAWREGGLLRLIVADNGVGVSQAEQRPEGIGLSTTRARLRELYGSRFTLALHNKDGTEVEITLPFRTDKEASTSA